MGVFPQASMGGDNTHCQANPPVMPSRNRSLRLRCLEGTEGSSGFMGGGPPPPLPPPPENNAIPSTYRRQSIRPLGSPRPLRRRFHVAHRAAGDITDITPRDRAWSPKIARSAANEGTPRGSRDRSNGYLRPPPAGPPPISGCEPTRARKFNQPIHRHRAHRPRTDTNERERIAAGTTSDDDRWRDVTSLVLPPPASPMPLTSCQLPWTPDTPRVFYFYRVDQIRLSPSRQRNRLASPGESAIVLDRGKSSDRERWG